MCILSWVYGGFFANLLSSGETANNHGDYDNDGDDGGDMARVVLMVVMVQVMRLS